MNGERIFNVLVVEDDPPIQDTIRVILEHAGFSVRTAADGVEALQKIRNPTPDLIITDLLMPRMDGYELVMKLSAHREWREIPVIILSAHGTSMPPHHFLRKPFEIESLLHEVESALLPSRGISSG